MLIRDEDKRELSVVFIISVICFVIFIVTHLYINFHEFGHATACVLFGGNATIEKSDYGWETICYSYGLSETQTLIFLMAGIGVEIFLAFILLLIPLTSPLGAFMVLNVVFNLIRGAYLYDLQQAMVIAPIVAPLLNPIIQLILFISGLLILILSLLYLWWFVKKVDIPYI